MIANDFQDVWWNDAAYEDSRVAFETEASSPADPLKYEVAQHVSGLALPTSGPLADELALFRAAVIDGVITTNYDDLMEQLFPSFEVFVGQEEMLFAETQGVGEIYKIHGSIARPRSLVLTDEDYDEFNARNAYLAAKLLTTFVERPVVFLGYSLGDENIQQVLAALVRCLSTAHVNRLSDRLMFIDFQVGAGDGALINSSLTVEGSPIPVAMIKTDTYVPILTALGRHKRKYPARLLRLLKEEVSELVRSATPTSRTFVVDIDDNTDLRKVEVVVGVGVMAAFGKKGLTGVVRADLLEDVLFPVGSWDAGDLVKEVLPTVCKQAKYVPIFKQLRQAELLNRDGSLKDRKSLDRAVLKRYDELSGGTEVPGQSQKKAAEYAANSWAVKDVEERFGPDAALICYAGLGSSRTQLKNFLVRHKELLTDTSNTTRHQQYLKALCHLDWMYWFKG